MNSINFSFKKMQWKAYICGENCCYQNKQNFVSNNFPSFKSFNKFWESKQLCKDTKI